MTARHYGIGLFAPAGFAPEPEAIDRAASRLEALGHRVVIDRTCKTRWQRFAATDDERLAAIGRMASDPEIELAITVRGGYGWSRLVDRIDYGALAAARKRWMGYSDFTAFQLAALAHADMTTFAGPMAAFDFGAETPSAFTLDHCCGPARQRSLRGRVRARRPRLHGEGRLWGGNLAMIAHLAGTPHLPRIDGGILFLEDVGESPYRCERMLYQLHLAGRARAPASGAARHVQRLRRSPTTTTATTRRRWWRRPARTSATRIYTGLPFGHMPEKLTLPVGGRCALAVRDGQARLVLSDYAR